MKYIYLLGACGSIGTQTLDIIRKNNDKLKLVGLSLGRDLDLGRKIIEEFKPEIICFREENHMNDFQDIDAIKCYGDKGLLMISSYVKYKNELLVNALVGSVGLKPTVEAIKAGKNIALANKETLVMAGDQINKLVKENGVNLYPIDSEHSAIWQCIQGENKNEISSLIITASGGSFRDKKREELKGVTKAQALNHPNWSMGPKITIDSASMMNKGFEVIEAHHLFNIPYDSIKTIMHRESVVHSMVEFKDNSIKAQLGTADMREPISYALLYPNHFSFEGEKLDLLKLKTLHFEELSMDRFKCLKFAYEAGKKGGLYPCVLNAANEAAVNLFLNDKIEFLDIEKIIEEELSVAYTNSNPTIDEILLLDKEIQNKILKKYEVK